MVKKNLMDYITITKKICKEQNWRYEKIPVKTAAAYVKATTESNPYIIQEDEAVYRTLLEDSKDRNPINELIWLENRVEQLTEETILYFLAAVLEETH